MPAKPFFDYKFMPYAPGAVAFLAKSLGMHPPDMDDWDLETHRHFGKAGYLGLSQESWQPELWWVTAFSHAHDGTDDAEARHIAGLLWESLRLVSEEWEEVYYFGDT